MPSLNTQLPNIDKLWFKQKLQDRKLTIRGIAKIMGLNPSSVSLTLSGKRGLPHNQAEQLAEILGVPLMEIYQRTGKSIDNGKVSQKLQLAQDIVAMVDGFICRVEQGENVNPNSLEFRNLKRAVMAFNQETV